MIRNQFFHLRRLREPEYRHLWLLTFWAVFGLWFLLTERFLPRDYHLVTCPLDARIPFCEWFVIPYVLWYGFVAAPVLVLLLTDVPAFRRMMYYIIITYGVVMVVYLVYPTCLNLRSTVFPRDNLPTRLVQLLYRVDTPANVCPSLHVVGSIAAALGLLEVPRLHRWRWAVITLALLISISTLFIKQHSLVDVATAVLLCAAAYPLVYRRKKTAAAPECRLS